MRGSNNRRHQGDIKLGVTDSDGNKVPFKVDGNRGWTTLKGEGTHSPRVLKLGEITIFGNTAETGSAAAFTQADLAVLGQYISDQTGQTYAPKA